MFIDDAEAGMTLTEDVLDSSGNLLLQKGITLTRSYIGHIKRLGINYISAVDQYTRDLQRNRALSETLHSELSACFQEIYQQKHDELLNISHLQLQLKKLNRLAAEIIAEISPKIPEIINYTIRKPSDSEVNHALNVCILSVITGLYLKMPEMTLRELLLGALLHDIGKSVIPYINNHPVVDASLHPILGSELIAKGRASTVVTRIIAEHHEAFDGTGFPRHLTGKNIHPLSRIVAIANYYEDAITTAEKQFTPRQEIVESMLAAGDTLFDLNLLRAFFHAIPVYPVGALLQLNNNKKAYVVKNRVHYPLRPIIRTAGSKEDIDLTFKPNITITRIIAE